MALPNSLNLSCGNKWDIKVLGLSYITPFLCKEDSSPLNILVVLFFLSPILLYAIRSHHFFFVLQAILFRIFKAYCWKQNRNMLNSGKFPNLKNNRIAMARETFTLWSAVLSLIINLGPKTEQPPGTKMHEF